MAFHGLMEFCIICGMDSNLIGHGDAEAELHLVWSG